jgi:hypothetical protein
MVHPSPPFTTAAMRIRLLRVETDEIDFSPSFVFLNRVSETFESSRGTNSCPICIFRSLCTRHGCSIWGTVIPASRESAPTTQAGRCARKKEGQSGSQRESISKRPQVRKGRRGRAPTADDVPEEARRGLQNPTRDRRRGGPSQKGEERASSRIGNSPPQLIPVLCLPHLAPLPLRATFSAATIPNGPAKTSATPRVIGSRRTSREGPLIRAADSRCITNHERVPEEDCETIRQAIRT